MTYTKKPRLDVQKAMLCGSINNSTRSQKNKIKNSKLDTSLPPVNFASVYMYQYKSWHYKGMSCMLCNKIMNDDYVIKNHHYVCEVNIVKKSTNT